MKYALLIYADESSGAEPGSDQAQQEFDAYMEFTRQISEEGANLGGEALHPTATATTVRIRNGDVITTDGPFAETKEALGGFYLIEASDLDAAIDIAARCPGAQTGSIELRPIWTWE